MIARAITAAFEITTALNAPAADVWAGAVEFDGINYELGPWMSMTLPKGVDPKMTIEEVPLGEPIGRSWVRLMGIPVEYDDLCLVEREPMRFLERSKMASADLWQHERAVVATGGQTCEITDRLEIDLKKSLRAIGMERVAPRIMRVLFTHRHKRLAKRWGAANVPD